MADEIEEGETPEVAETPVAETPPAEPKAEKDTALDALTAGIEEGQARRPIVAKSDDTPEAKDDASRPRNPDGTFKTETDEEKAAREEAERIAKETPEEKAAREKKETEEAKKADPINDPVPDNLNKRTAERIKSLIETVKAQNELAAQHNSLFETITSTGASPSEFARMVDYMRFVHSNDPATLERAYGVLQGELRGLAVRLGKPLDEVNLLGDDGNQDLVRDVQGGVLTVERAQELAILRAQKQQRAQAETQQTTTQKQQQEAQAAQEAGVKSLDALDTKLRGRDGDAVFNAKYDVLVPMLKGLFSRLDPREWEGVFLDQYEKLNLPPTAAAPPAPVDKQRPMRPTAPAGSSDVRAAPKSALEALSQALEGA